VSLNLKGKMIHYLLLLTK